MFLSLFFRFFFRSGLLLNRQLQKTQLQASARCISVVHGNINALAPKVRKHIEDNVALCQPKDVHICDGSEAEYKHLLNTLMQNGQAVPMPKYEGWYVRDKFNIKSIGVLSVCN